MAAKGGKPRQANSASSDALFEQAYIYYRKNENAEALAEIAKADQEDIRFMELKAQLFYRLERSEEALELFKKIIATHHDEHDETRKANLIAVLVQLQTKKGGDVEGVEAPAEPETFEQMYNVACHLMESGKNKEAVELLDRTEALCRETLTEDGFTEAEIDEELVIIRTQKAYCLQQMGLKEEVLQLYNLIQRKESLADANVKAVLLNNQLSAQGSATLGSASTGDIRKELRLISKKKKAKLNTRQRQTILFNLALLQLTPVAQKDTNFQEIVTGKIHSRKRKRKTVLPKNYDPNMPPDPERWLPRSERTAHKKRNKKFKDRDIGRGTQGTDNSSTSAQQAIDYSNKASSAEPQHSSPRPTPSMGAAEGPRQARPGGAQPAKKAKKKKGGGKW